MAKKQSAFKTKGMNRDLSVSAFNPEFSFENKNLRLSTNDDNTTMSWVNERGTLPLDLYKEVTYPKYWTKEDNIVYEDPEDNTWTLHEESTTVLEPTTILGTPVGTSLIENKLVLFTHISSSEDVEKHDYIYVITYLDEQKTKLKVREFLSGNYNFSVRHPLETISSYESENVQKVYWTDYLNNFRYINIEGVPEDEKRKMDARLLFNEEVTVARSFENTGSFPPGVIQYAFTYVEKYGAETPVVYTTPLYYIVDQNGLGASADSGINTRFTVTISGINNNYGKIRLYSIIRTSLDATPEVKMVAERNVPPSDTSVIIEDTNAGTTVDSLTLPFMGASDLRIGTIAQKDGVLFYGNIAASWEKDVFYTYLEPSVKSLFTNAEVTSVLSQRDFAYTEEETSPFPIRINTATTSTGECTSAAAFKAREYYRLGIQFQTSSGIWSEPLFLGDYQWNTQDFHGPLYEKENDEWTFKVPEFTLELDAETQQSLFDVGYRRARAVYVQPNTSGRTILYQGIACPTIRHKKDGNNNYPSWLFRFKWRDNKGFSVYPSANDSRLQDYVEAPNNSSFWSILNSTNNKGVYKDKNTYTLEFFESIIYNYDTDDSRIARTTGTAIRELFGRVQYGNFVEVGNSAYKLHNMHEEGDSTRLSLCSSSEIQFPSELYIDNRVVSLHSPDIEYGELLNYLQEFYPTSYSISNVGTVVMKCTTGNVIIDLGGSSAINVTGDYPGGVTYNPDKNSAYYTQMPPECAFMSPQIYADTVVTVNSEGRYVPFIASSLYQAVENDDFWFYSNRLYSWPVYMWHRKGSLNNDIDRSDGTVRTGVYKKKIFAHYRISKESVWKTPVQVLYDGGGRIFNKINADTSLRLGDNSSRLYSGSPEIYLQSHELTDDRYKRFFLCRKIGNEYKTGRGGKNLGHNTYCLKTPYINDGFNVVPQFYLRREKDTVSQPPFYRGIYIYGYDAEKFNTKLSPSNYNNEPLQWRQRDVVGYNKSDVCDLTDDLVIKYTSSSHCVLWGLTNSIYDYTNGNIDDVQLPILEITSAYNPNTFFGGQSPEVLSTHTWIPCGPPVTINDEAQESVNVEYKWGDTYFQWYECVKTNPTTDEDSNQVIEVGGFFLENRVNLIGRYDNQVMSPSTVLTKIDDVKFNPVYSQFDNYFNYKIVSENPEDEVRSDTIKAYSNNIFYSVVKTSGQTPDPWTEINRNSPSSFEVDGRYGAITKLINFDNQVYVFQERAVSQILYNENVQISSTEGVPIEIANSEKVRGVRYISTTIGCSNKYSIVSTPRGIYFIGTDDKSLYLFNGQLTNLSTSAGFNSWFKQKVPINNVSWNPVDFGNFVSYYDALNQDVLFLNNETALAFSEKVGNFTSFYDYGDIPFFCNFDGTGLWIDKDGLFWKHNEGDYCRFFGVNKPYSMTLIGNPEPQTDKVFTNLEFRACIEGELSDAIPFDYLETWDEYQHGIANLDIKEGIDAAQHYLLDNSASLNRKFRMWRCDIPRDNAKIDAERIPGNALENYSTDAELGVTRDSAHSMDRMRNPWLYLKLQKNAAEDYFDDDINSWRTESLPKLEIHDLVMTYYN